MSFKPMYPCSADMSLKILFYNSRYDIVLKEVHKPKFRCIEIDKSVKFAAYKNNSHYINRYIALKIYTYR